MKKTEDSAVIYLTEHFQKERDAKERAEKMHMACFNHAMEIISQFSPEKAQMFYSTHYYA